MLSEAPISTILNATDEAPMKRRGGRPPGSKNRRTIAVAEAMQPLVPKVKRRLLRLIEGEDGDLVYRAASLILAYTYGRPTERKEVGGIPGQPIATTSAAARVDLLALVQSAAAQLGRTMKPGAEQVLTLAGKALEAGNDD